MAKDRALVDVYEALESLAAAWLMASKASPDATRPHRLELYKAMQALCDNDDEYDAARRAETARKKARK